MGAIFGGGSSQPAVIQAPAPIVPVAPSGPQLAPGQKKPGGPVGPVGDAGWEDPNETYEDRMWRLSRGGSRMSILGGDSGVGNSTASGPASPSTGAEGSSSDGTI